MSNNMVIPRVLAIYATIVSRISPCPARSAMQLEEPEGTVMVAVDPVISSDNIVALNHATLAAEGIAILAKGSMVCVPYTGKRNGGLEREYRLVKRNDVRDYET